MKRERARRRSRRRRRVGKSSGACPNTAWGISEGTPQDGQLHFSRNLRENANARGIWQQWPWSAAPILRVGFSVEGKGDQDDEGCGQGMAGREGETDGELCRPCKAARSTAVAAAATPTTDLGYIPRLSQPPDKGGQPRSIRGLPTHPTHLCSSIPLPPGLSTHRSLHPSSRRPLHGREKLLACTLIRNTLD